MKVFTKYNDYVYNCGVSMVIFTEMNFYSLLKMLN